MKSCPFCAADATIWPVPGSQDREFACGCRFCNVYFRSPQRSVAITAWNRRKKP